MKKLGIGCGGLMVLFIFVGVVAAAAGGGGAPSGSASGGGDSGDSQGQGSGGPETVGVGQTLTIGEAEWVVNEATPTDSLQSQFGEFGQDRTGNFVVVDLTFTNNSGEAVTLDSSTITLIDGQGRRFKADTDTMEYIPPERDLFLQQVNPGVSQQGTVIFTVAPDASDFRLEVGGAGFFSSETGYIKLGF